MASSLSHRTRIVAFTHVSNALGTVLPVREMMQMAHRRGARVLIDGAQAVSHFPVNVQELDADFYVLSGHKMFGPSAIGVVYGKKALLDEMPPWQGGGNMIQRVTFENSTFADPPARFEAGTATLGSRGRSGRGGRLPDANWNGKCRARMSGSCSRMPTML